MIRRMARRFGSTFCATLLLAAGAALVASAGASSRSLPCDPPGANGQVLAAARTVPFTLPRRSPRRLFRDLLANLGDRSLIEGRVSGDADNTYLHLQPRAPQRGAHALRVDWEQTIVAGGLRDLLCAARAPLLWSWTGIDGAAHGSPDRTYPYLQHFPSPSERVFRQRLAIAAHRWHFRVLDARYLRPLQGAPMVVAQTQHPIRLVRFARKIQQFLDPVEPSPAFQLGAWAYEGFYFEAEDANNRPAFVFANAERGTGVGSQWARCQALYPFAHSGGLLRDGRSCN
jgi:hypothetical protein